MNRAERRRAGRKKEKNKKQYSLSASQMNDFKNSVMQEANKRLAEHRSILFEEAYWEFCLITLDYLNRKRLWKREGIEKYLNFMAQNLESIGEGYYSFGDLREALSKELEIDLSQWIPSPEEYRRLREIEA